jgi:GTPase involved in cell partitioning and DNA repair
MLHNKFVKHFLSTSPPTCSKKQEFDELSKEVENFSSRLEAKVKAVVNEITARLTADFEKNEALLKANFEGEKNVLLSKIESLENLGAYVPHLSNLSRIFANP